MGGIMTQRHRNNILNRFDTGEDDEIIEYIENKIKDIKYLTEHRLYKEEQLQSSKDVIKVRNSLEWILRINKIIKFIKYSVKLSLDYSKKLKNPIDEGKAKDMYTYYLEDSVYRLIVAWDIYKQLVNEFYNVGYHKNNTYNIFKLKNKIKNKRIWDNDKIKSLEDYLDSKEHRYVRNYLRNTFTHNVDPTDINIFHEYNNNGITISQTTDLLPNHPYENLTMIIDDLMKLISFMKEVNNDVKDLLFEKVMMVNCKMTLKCDEKIELSGVNIGKLISQKENIAIENPDGQCIDCKDKIAYKGKEICKPKYMEYNRINEDKKTKIDINEKYPKGSLSSAIKTGEP